MNGEGVLDLPALGASPSRKDCFVYCQRLDDVDGAHCAREMARVVEYWSGLPCRNPDGSSGIALHPIWLPPIPRKDGGKPWWDQGNANLPPAARGLAHYMVISNGGGGQAGEMADMGGCGAHGLYATFLHEFGHQLGLTHSGGPGPGLCPTYTSLMSYAYNYAFGDDAGAIHYSRGDLAGIVLDETRLEERVPLPIERVRFLEKGPYRYGLEADGDATRIDWNRNGVFDEKPVRADITDVYGVDGGLRVRVGKTIFAPTLVEHRGKAFLLAVNRDGMLTWRECLGVERWSEEAAIEGVAPSGDPWAISGGGELFAFVPTKEGVAFLRAAKVEDLGIAPAGTVPEGAGCAVSAAVWGGRLLVLLWREADRVVRVSEFREGGSFSPPTPFATLVSAIAPAAVEDPKTGELVVGTGFHDEQGGARGWRIQRLRRGEDGSVAEVDSGVVGGEKSGWCGDSRPVLLWEEGEHLGPAGRIHFVARGMGSGDPDRGCYWEAITVGDRTQGGGWRLRRFYDEWTTTRSPVAACLHDGDLLLAFRWYGNVHGEEDDDLLVSNRGLGIREGAMSDFDDVTAIAEVGLERSIPWRRVAK